MTWICPPLLLRSLSGRTRTRGRRVPIVPSAVDLPRVERRKSSGTTNDNTGSRRRNCFLPVPGCPNQLFERRTVDVWPRPMSSRSLRRPRDAPGRTHRDSINALAGHQQRLLATPAALRSPLQGSWRRLASGPLPRPN